MLLLSVMVLPLLAQNRAKQVIAHRGYWKTEGSAQNSLSSLRNAKKLGIYGSEFDVHITRDGKAVVFHDNSVDGIRIEDANYADISDKLLANGEHIPLLEDYLAEAKKLSKMKLILEIKSHKQKQDEVRCVDEVLRLVKKAGLKSRTEYIAFSRNVCDYLVAHAPKAKVSYLKGDLTPQQVKQAGYSGIDYQDKVFRAHPTWIAEAKQLGLITNVWTVDKPNEIKQFFDAGVGYVTTNEPAIAKDL